MRVSLEKIGEVIKSNKSFSIYSHMKADIDAIGSSLALKRILEKLGKKADVFIDSVMPDNAKMFEDTKTINTGNGKQYDVAVVLDANSDSRLGRLKYKYKKNIKTTIVIDHHQGSLDFAKFSYANTNVSSTCEIIYKLAKILNIEFDKEICKLLICGIYTDTGSLIHSNTMPSTFEALADMQKKSGFVMDELTGPLFNSMSKAGFELRKIAYNRLELYCEDKIAFIYFTNQDFKTLNISMIETEGITDIGLKLASTKVIAMVSEEAIEDKSLFYVSLRSKGDYRANNIANEFGGGGHLKAAGCRIIGTLSEVKKQIIEASEKEIKRVEEGKW